MNDAKDPVSEFLSEQAKETNGPQPKDLGVTAVVLERWLFLRLMPVVGCALFPLGVLILSRQGSSRVLATVLATVGALLTMLWLGITAVLHDRRSGHYLGSAFASLWIAALTVLHRDEAFSWAPALLVGSLFIAAVATRVVHARASWLFVGFLLTPFSDGADATDKAIALLISVGLFVALEFRASRGLATLIAWLVVAQTMNYAPDRHQPFLGELSVLFALPVALSSQLRVDKQRVSDWRLLNGELAIAGALGAAILLFNADWSLSSSLWAWASLVTLTEIAGVAYDRTSVSPRLGCAALALNIALSFGCERAPWHSPLFALLLTGALLQIYAQRYSNRFASQLADAFVASAAIWLVAIARRAPASAAGLIVGCLAAMALLCAATQPQPPTGLAYWRGFLSWRQLVLLRGYTLRILRPIWKLRLFGLVLGWLSLPFIWLRYLRVQLFPAEFRYLTYTAAHALAVWMLTDQGAQLLLWNAHGPEVPVYRAMLAPLLGCSYGVVVARRGAKNPWPYARVSGACCAAFPALRAWLSTGSLDPRVLAILLMVTGVAFALISSKPKSEPAANLLGSR